MLRNRPALRNTLTAIVALLSAGAAGAGGPEGLDRDPAVLAVNDTARRSEAAVECFVTRVPAAGVLTLDAAVAGDAAAMPRLRLTPRSAPLPQVLDQRANHLTLAFFEPGIQGFCVGAQDPRQRLAGLRVRTAFAAFAGGPRIDGKSIRTKSEEEEEEDPGEIELEPGLAGAGELTLPELEVAELCHRDEIDDHGDTFLCATAFAGGTIEGELANDWGDDHDVFTFVVTEQQTVEITSAGVDAFGSLLNAVGDRLAANDGGDDGAGFRLVKTLVPGRYFVRVEGARGAEGAYTITVRALDGWR